MNLYRAVLLALFVVGGALVAAPAGATTHAAEGTTPGVAASTASSAVSSNDTTAANDTSANSSLGTDISSFMQSSAAEVGGAVETGMWSAAFNGTENESVRVELVETRTSKLRGELADLRQRRAELVGERERGDISETAYKAKVSRLLGEIDALRSAIDATANRAEEVNANVESLGSLRSETENLTGPEIAAVARNVTGAGVGNGERGPDGVGDGPGNSEGAGDGTGNAASGAGEAANDTTPDNAGRAGGEGAENGNADESDSNGDDAGESKGLSDAGNETGVANGNGPGDATNGTRGPPSDAGETLTTTDFFDRVSTAFVAGTGLFLDGDIFVV